jgi:hypothetical protein
MLRIASSLTYLFAVVTQSHRGDSNVTIRIEVDIGGTG